MSEYIYLPDFDGEWSIMSEDEYDATGGADTYGRTLPVELAFSLDGARGHYLAADFLSEAADLLDGIQVGVPSDVVDLSQPENFGLRDRVDEIKHEANDAWARYHAHNDLPIYANESKIADYGRECLLSADGYPDCPCDSISDLADAMESVLGDLGFVTEWNDGVRVYRVGIGRLLVTYSYFGPDDVHEGDIAYHTHDRDVRDVMSVDEAVDILSEEGCSEPSSSGPLTASGWWSSPDGSHVVDYATNLRCEPSVRPVDMDDETVQAIAAALS